MSDDIAKVVGRAMAKTFQRQPEDPVQYFAYLLLNEIEVRNQLSEAKHRDQTVSRLQEQFDREMETKAAEHALQQEY